MAHTELVFTNSIFEFLTNNKTIYNANALVLVVICKMNAKINFTFTC